MSLSRLFRSCLPFFVAGAVSAQAIRRDASDAAVDLLVGAGMPDVALRVLELSDAGGGSAAETVRALVEARRRVVGREAPAEMEKAVAAAAARLAGAERPASAVAAALEFEIAELWRRCAVAWGDDVPVRRRCAEAARRGFDALRAEAGGRAPRDASRAAAWARATHRAAEARLLAAPLAKAPEAPDVRREARDLFDALALESESDPAIGGWLPWALEGSCRACRALGDAKGAAEAFDEFRRAVLRVDPADPAFTALVDAGGRLAAELGASFDVPRAPSASASRPGTGGPPPSPLVVAATLRREGRRIEAAEALEIAAATATPSEAFEARLEALEWRAEAVGLVEGPARIDAARDVGRRARDLLATTSVVGSASALRGVRRLAASTLLSAAPDGPPGDTLAADAAAFLAPLEADVAADPEGWVETRVLRTRLRLRSGALDSAAADIDALVAAGERGASVVALARRYADALERAAVAGAPKVASARAYRRWLDLSGTTAGADAFDAVGWKLREAGLHAEAATVDEEALGRFDATEPRRARWRLRAAEAREHVARIDVREGRDPSSSLRAARFHLSSLRAESGGRALAERRDARALDARIEGGQAVDASGTWTWIAGLGDTSRASGVWSTLRDEAVEPWVWEARFHMIVLSALSDRSAGRDPAAARTAFTTLEALHPALGGPAWAARFRWAERAFLR